MAATTPTDLKPSPLPNNNAVKVSTTGSPAITPSRKRKSKSVTDYDDSQTRGSPQKRPCSQEDPAPGEIVLDFKSYVKQFSRALDELREDVNSASDLAANTTSKLNQKLDELAEVLSRFGNDAEQLATFVPRIQGLLHNDDLKKTSHYDNSASPANASMLNGHQGIDPNFRARHVAPYSFGVGNFRYFPNDAVHNPIFFHRGRHCVGTPVPSPPQHNIPYGHPSSQGSRINTDAFMGSMGRDGRMTGHDQRMMVAIPLTVDELRVMILETVKSFVKHSAVAGDHCGKKIP